MKQNRRTKNTRDFEMDGESLSLSIGQLSGLREAQSCDSVPEQPAEKILSPAPPARENVAATFTQVTLHRQSAGRGGRTVTLVAIKPLPASDVLESLARELRKGLGCGAHVEEDRIVLQGDIPDRAQEWFSKKGTRKIVRGN